MDAWFNTLPSWIGTLPQWGMLILLGIAIVRTSPDWLKLWLEAKAHVRNDNRARIRELEEAVRNCHSEWQAEVAELRAVIHGMRDQRASEQIAIMRAILRTVDDPALRKQLEMLESLHVSIRREGADYGDADEGA